jgi:hypothetical protein
MPIRDLILGLIPLVLQLCIAAILLRKRRLYRRFPWFFAYTVYSVATAIVRAAFLPGNRDTYIQVFWGTEVLYALLGLIAIYEAFREIFDPFYPIWWFRPLLYVVTLLTVGLSVGKAIQKPPIQADQLGMLILSFEIGVRYLQAGIFALSFVLILFFRLPARRYPVGIVDGFGATAIGILVASTLRSDFGTRFNKLFSFIPPVLYIGACVIWLVSLWGSENRNGDQNGNDGSKPSIPLEEMSGQLRRFLETTKKISKRRWK